MQLHFFSLIMKSPKIERNNYIFQVIDNGSFVSILCLSLRSFAFEHVLLLQLEELQNWEEICITKLSVILSGRIMNDLFSFHFSVLFEFFLIWPQSSASSNSFPVIPILFPPRTYPFALAIMTFSPLLSQDFPQLCSFILVIPSV